MSNINTYLEWRGDVPFSIDPFNEVDNLILSELTYTDFDGIDGIESGLLGIKEVQEMYFNLHTREEIKNRKTFVALAPLLLDPLSNSSRFKNLKIGYYTNIYDEKNVVQFSGVTYQLDDFVYISFRGTDDTLVGWKEDFYFSYRSGTAGQLAAVDYLNSIEDRVNLPLHIGGHSKGGNLAIYGATFCKDSVKEKIETIWGNDSPGFTAEVTETEEFKNIMDKICLIIPESSIVGMLMDNKVTPKIIKSDSKFILQHDALTWQVKRNKFVSSKELSQEAIFVDKAITSWLAQIPEEQRKDAIDSAFYCLEASNVKTFVELRAGGLETVKAVLGASKDLSEEQNKLITKLFFGLISNSRNLMFGNIKNKFIGPIDRV